MLNASNILMEAVKEVATVITCISNLSRKVLRKSSSLKCIYNTLSIGKNANKEKAVMMIGEKLKG